jgi:tyrosyl-tRNA synthetase
MLAPFDHERWLTFLEFFLRCADADVERYLKLFTFLPMSVIKSTMEEHSKDESKRIAQHKLAYEFVELVHGLGNAQRAEEQHRRLFGHKISVTDLRAPAKRQSDSETGGAAYSTDMNPSLNKYAPQTNVENMGPLRITLPGSLILGQPLSKILWSAGLVSSRSEGQRLINNRGAHIGSTSDRTGRDMGDGLSFAPITSWKPYETSRFIIDGNLLILRVGKWKVKIIDIVSDEEYEKTGQTAPGWNEAEGNEAGKGESYKEAHQRREEFYKERKETLAERAEERRMKAKAQSERPDKSFEQTGETAEERVQRLNGEGERQDGRRRKRESPYGVVTSATWE